VGGESDYYKITLNETEAIGADITTAESLGDLALRLYAPDRTQVASDGNDFGGIEISHQASMDGTYYVEITGQSQQTTSNYELQTNQTFVSTDNGNATTPETPFTEPLPGVQSNNAPTDTDDDGLYEDVNGDGQATFEDAVSLAFADTSTLSQAQATALDFDGDGDVDFNDAVELAFL